MSQVTSNLILYNYVSDSIFRHVCYALYKKVPSMEPNRFPHGYDIMVVDENYTVK